MQILQHGLAGYNLELMADVAHRGGDDVVVNTDIVKAFDNTRRIVVDKLAKEHMDALRDFTTDIGEAGQSVSQSFDLANSVRWMHREAG